MRKQTSSAIIFSIVNIIDKTNRNNAFYSDVNDELNEFKNNNVQHKQSVRRISEGSEGSTVAETSTNGLGRQKLRNDKRIRKKPRFLPK